MNKFRRKVNDYIEILQTRHGGCAVTGWDICTRDRTLRNINILAVGTHWRLPKCPTGASADQVPVEYGGRRNHSCDDCRCCVYYDGGRTCAARKKTNRGAGRIEKGRGDRRRRRRESATNAASLPLIGSPEINTHNSFGTRSRASLLAML